MLTPAAPSPQEHQAEEPAARGATQAQTDATSPQPTVQSGTEAQNRSAGKSTRLDGRDVAETVPTFANYDEAQEWVEDKAKEYGGKRAFTASRLYAAVQPQLAALYESVAAASNAERMKALADAGLKIGDKVEMTSVGAFLNVSRHTGTITQRAGAPWVKIDGEMTFSSRGRLSTVKSVAWDSRWKPAEPKAPLKPLAERVDALRATTQAEPSKPQTRAEPSREVIELRKREAVLKKLLDCMKA